MVVILPFKTFPHSKERPGESAYDREERKAREFYALPEQERERAMDAKAGAILERIAKNAEISPAIKMGLTLGLQCL